MAPGPSAAWIHAIDATYVLFEQEEHRNAYPALAAKVASAVRIIEAAIAEVERCALSFNGGKDCTVLAHLLAAVLRRHTHAGPTTLPRLESLYVACQSPFAEVEQFIAYAASASTGYHMDLHMERGAMKVALAKYLDGAPGEALAPVDGSCANEAQPQPRQVQAIFIGVRETDPHGSTLGVRSPTDPGWPQILRVHPILDWDYATVWSFLRCPVLGTPGARYPSYVGGGGAHGVPYCSLYDQGYTSLGSTYNTRPNPRLRVEGAEAVYRPAFELRDAALERAGRG
ncbi:hypothetical protein CBS9595_002746 [Malassezia furfur]|nr:hypothetical protein CBS9595_002746 [Malassezia furfur]